MKLDEYITEIQQSSSLYKNKQYSEAHTVIDSLLKESPFQPDLLLKKFFIEHFTEQGTIEEIETTVKNAEKVLPKYPATHIEQGNWHYSVKGDNKESLKAFKKAKSLAENYLIEAYKGIINGMIAEGNLKALQCRQFKIDENDHFTRLIKTAHTDVIGCTTVKEIPE